jgi:diguanylate cyclase (GGDEF)-like protein
MSLKQQDKVPKMLIRHLKGRISSVRLTAATIAAVLGVLAAALISVAFYSANSMDRNVIQRQQALIDNTISTRLSQSLSELRSVAWWDEMVVKSRGDQIDTDWLDIEVGVFVTESYKHDRLVILDEDNHAVYGFGDDKRLSAEEQALYAKAVAPLAAQIRGGPNASPRIRDKSLTDEMRESSKITERSYGRGAAALISVGGKPMLASVMAITPSIDMSLNSKRPRLLVSLIALNRPVIAELGKSILIPNLTLDARASKAGASTALVTDDAKSLGVLNWTPEFPGRALISDILPFILLILAATGVSMLILVRRLFASTTKLIERQRDAQYLANHDALTGLPNRRLLETELFRRSGNVQGESSRLACAVIDLDRFKDINDTLGHSAGDALITAVGNRLSATLRPTDFVARLGGDEFAILRDCHELGDSEDLSSAVAHVFAEPFPILGHQIETGASVGVAVSGFDRAVENLMREADIALYEAKAKEKGTSVRFVPAMATKIEQRRSLEVDLKVAVANRALSMHYQPIVDAHTGAVESVEALVRWTCPKHGNVPPDVFVAIAEETGMMAELGKFVIEQAIEDSKRWPNITTAINISPAQLRSASIVQDLLKPTRTHNVLPSQITIEITESLLMSNDKRTIRTLNILKDHGFAIALDDFGTGYSSLAYIRDFPFDKLKIDRSFVTGQDLSARSIDIIKAVVNFGRILGREVVAEGIETEQEMQAMQNAGVTHLQGYLFSKPLPAAHIEALIAASGRLTAARTVDRATIDASKIDRSFATKLRNIA